MRVAAAIATSLLLLCLTSVQAQPRVEVRIDTGQAEAVLRILEKLDRKASVDDQDWKILFATTGYVRLKKRELAMGRSFEDADFASFVRSPELLARRTKLARALDDWKRVDVAGISRSPLAYLPLNARIRATIYPVIKPRTNSFVFEVKSDPAIFMYLDPEKRKEVFENELSHELHHIGFASIPEAPSDPTLSASQNKVVTWIGAFGEGFAMLAAAGGPDVHPHRSSPAADRERWDRDVANFNQDLRKVEKFFLDLAEGKLDETSEREIAVSFYGVQGPWYTVGWKMAVVIEKTFGRKKLIESITDHRKLLPTYNRAVRIYNSRTREALPLWSDKLIAMLSGTHQTATGAAIFP